jgi:hypothetical protein
LLATAADALAAGIVGSMTGRREIMAALSPVADITEEYSPDENGEFWFDYMADCGDGWNASHSVAWLLGRNAIVLDKECLPTRQPVPDSNIHEGVPQAGDAELLPAGQLLMLGGDQVYPAASPENYETRFSNIMSSARFWQQGKGRHVYAIPGNHDWYDGLTNFIRLFCQGVDDRRWFGAWQTVQRRSYFSVELPHGWWLWGVDMALEDDLDPPQLAYFRAAAQTLKPRDRVILCVPTPSWLQKCEEHKLHSTRLQIMIDIARGKFPAFARVPLIISGDLHYYARHEAEHGGHTRHYVTCGGGGAFTLGTLQTAEKIAMSGSDRTVLNGIRKKQFPDELQSRAMRRGVLGFPWTNPGFSALLGGAQLLVLWLLSAIAWSEPVGNAGRGWLITAMSTPFSFGGFWQVQRDAAIHCITSPGLALLVAALLAGFGAYGRSGTAPDRSKALSTIIGIVHGVAQVVLGLGVVWFVAQGFGATEIRHSVAVWLAAIAGGVVLMPLCGLLFGFYLFASHCGAKMHDLEVYSAQGIERFKAFLRIRITAEGLTVFPVGLVEIARKWRLAPGVERRKSRSPMPLGQVPHFLRVPEHAQRIFDPETPLEPQLIEYPIHIFPKLEVSHA